MLQTSISRIDEDSLALVDLRNGTAYHLLWDTVAIAAYAALSDANSWEDVETFGRANRSRLRESLELPNGIPCRDTFRNVFAHLDVGRLRTHLSKWSQAARHVAVWTCQDRLVFGHIKPPADDPGEKMSIPQLLATLDVSGCIVTLDLAGCQKRVAEQVIAQRADYVLAVREDSESLYDDLRTLVEYAAGGGWIDYSRYQATGRRGKQEETRTCYVISARDSLFHVPDLVHWKGLETLIMVGSELRTGTRYEGLRVGYFISSVDRNDETAFRNVCLHWRDDDRLHWMLDIAYRADECRARAEDAAGKLAALRHLSMADHSTSLPLFQWPKGAITSRGPLVAPLLNPAPC